MTLTYKRRHKSEEKYVHDIIIDNPSLLYEILGKQKIKVNSRHSYALHATNELLVSGRSEDGVIEAVERKDKKFDLKLKQLDTEHNALQTEYEAVKGVVDKNVEKTFNIFS